MTVKEFNLWLEEGANPLPIGTTVCVQQKNVPATSSSGRSKLSLLEEMEREREMWESKTTALLSGPGTASTTVAIACSTDPAGDRRQQLTRFLLGGRSLPGESMVMAAEEEQETGNGNDKSPEEPVQSSDSDGSRSEEEINQPGGRIAAALSAAGLQPHRTVLAGLLRHEPQRSSLHNGIDSADAETAPAVNKRRTGGARQWAAQQLRRKKERAGLCSRAVTPCGSGEGCGLDPQVLED